MAPAPLLQVEWAKERKGHIKEHRKERRKDHKSGAAVTVFPSSVASRYMFLSGACLGGLHVRLQDSFTICCLRAYVCFAFGVVLVFFAPEGIRLSRIRG